MRVERIDHGRGRCALGKEHVVLGVEYIAHGVALDSPSIEHASLGVDLRSLRAGHGTHRHVGFIHERRRNIYGIVCGPNGTIQVALS